MSDNPSPAPPSPEGKEPYNLEPDEPVPMVSKSAPRPTKVGDAGLLDDFDEDADFDRDPEVEKAVKGPSAPPSPPASNTPEFVKPGWGDAQPLALIASGVLLAGVIAACVTTRRPWYAAGASAAYSVVLQTVTGTTAVAVAAHLTQMRMGSLPLAAARMFMAVSIFTLIFHLNIPITGRADEVVLAAAAYVGTVWLLFRLKSEPLFILVAIHAGLWLSIWIAILLGGWEQAVVVKPPA